MAERDKERRDVYFHPDFAKTAGEIGFYEASYRGGNDYLTAEDPDGDPVLVKLDRESADHFKARKALATVRNVCRPLVDRTSNYIFGEARADQIQRSEAEELSKWSEDVDLEGTTLHDFMRERYRAAQIGGWSWILVDAPETETQEPPEGSEEEELEEGGAAADDSDDDTERVWPYYLVGVDANAVVDWEYQDGELVRLVILDAFTVKTGLAAAAEKVAYLYEWIRIGDVVKVRTIELDTESEIGPDKAHAKAQGTPPEGWTDEDGDQATGALYLRVVPTSFDRLPFVRVEFPGSISQIAEVAHSQRRIVNLKSWEDAELSKTFSTVVISGASDEDVSEVARSAMNVICVENENAKIEVLGADAEQAKSLRESREAEEKDVARGSNLEASHRSIETKAAESGEKRKRDLESLYQVLAAMAGKAQEAEREVLRLIESLTGTKKLAEEVSYPTSFDVQSVEELILEILELQKIPYVPDAFLRAAVRAFIQKRASREPAKVLQGLVDAVDEALPPFDDERSSRAFFLKDAGLASRVDLFMGIFAVPEELDAEKDPEGRKVWDRTSDKHRAWVLDFLKKVREEDEAIAPPPMVDEEGNPLPPGTVPPEGEEDDEEAAA